MLLFSFPCLVARQIVWVIFPLRFILSLIPMLIFVLFFIWRLIWDVLNHFRMKPDGSHVTSLFLGNNRQHRPVCAKTISSWVRKVLCVAKAHMSLGSLWGAAASAALAAGVSLVSILQAGDWARVSTLARHYFSTLHYYCGYAPGLCTACHAGPQWVGLPLVSVKHWLIFSLAYVGLSGHSSPQYWANSSSIVCVILALDCWNNCSGEQAQQPNIFLSMFALHGFID